MEALYKFLENLFKPKPDVIEIVKEHNYSNDDISYHIRYNGKYVNGSYTREESKVIEFFEHYQKNKTIIKKEVIKSVTINK